ncbi:type II toxin-antitoxin system RelE/ParE family toxin [Algiphilus sp. W345]|uniref:Type II toxin-antitoxin system RelE/ParE family toxin n=1 Tax=Banduia mediterranea TaxID=3075609 RepID=A0ABU2WFG5_9GAMM|nr:type II toxin-antitoxin system RelE/ParE family toxin [Algiphilus sp. W345]MDT0496349.1 type II toxin-antitoxin system RelE/ParE family toxin [Algiphilus sp. W345]
MGGSKAVFCNFPDAVQQDAGFQLSKAQRGDPADSFKSMKSMNAVGSGVMELIVNDEDGWFRVFYFAKFPPAVYVLHAFLKNERYDRRRHRERP